MNKKLGPLPIWAWALIAGGTIGGVILYKKSKATTTETAEGETIPSLGAQAVEGTGGGGVAGSTGESTAATEIANAKAELAQQELAFLSENSGHGGALGNGISEVEQAEEGLRALGLLAPESSTKTAASSESSNAAKNAQGKFPLTSSRGNYRVETIKGKIVHVYEKAVHGGVGKGKNEIVIKGPETVSHASNGDHTGVPTTAASKPQPTSTGGGFTLTSSRGDYRDTTYKGKAAHEYSKSVSGGVGPKKNLIIV